MAIHTNLYLLVFLPLVLIIYQLAPKKARWGVLLAASYALYISFSKYIVYFIQQIPCASADGDVSVHMGNRPVAG